MDCHKNHTRARRGFITETRSELNLATVSQHHTRRRGRWEEGAASVLPDLRNMGSWDQIPPMWLEGRIYLEYLSLIRDPLYRGVDVPPGLGRPVLLIPRFLARDGTPAAPFVGLRRG